MKAKKCVRCGYTEDDHRVRLFGTCHMYDEPAPWWLMWWLRLTGG